MDKIKTFFKKIGYTDILDKLQDEETKISDIVDSFQTEFRDVIETELKDKGDDGVNEDEIYKKVKNSLFQKVKTGLKLSDIGNVKDYEDDSKFIDAVKTEVSEREKQGDEALKTKYEAMVDKHNSTVDEIDQLNGKLNKKDEEFSTYKTNFENEIQTKNAYDQLFDAYEFGVSDVIKNDYKKNWWNELKNDYKYDPDSKKITDKDGQFIVVDKRKIDTLDELLKYKIQSRGLEKQNNGRPAGKFSGNGSTASDDREIQQWADTARKGGVSDDVINRYIKNRKPVEQTQK